MAIDVSRAACRSRCTIWVLTGSTCRPELGEHVRLDVRLQMAVRADRPGDLAGPDLVHGRGEAGAAPIHLEGPSGQLETHGRRLRVDRVGPPHHGGVRFGSGARDQGDDERVGVLKQAHTGCSQLDRQAGVHDVAAGQTQVQVAALRPDRFGHLRDEGDDVVVRRPLDLGDPLDIHRRPRLEGREGLARHATAGGLRPGYGEFHPKHRLEAGLLGPDRAHLGQRVATDHGPASTDDPGVGPSARASAAMSRRRWAPSNTIHSAARSARSRAAGRSSPRPTTASTRPPAVR